MAGGAMVQYMTQTVGLILLLLIGSQGDRTLHVTFMKSRCDYCKMLFQFERFGGELETTADSSVYFDATECMVAYRLSHMIAENKVRRLWSVDYNAPGKLIDARAAVYVNSPNLASPMEVNIAAFRSVAAADSAIARYGGKKLDWQAIVALVGRKWFGGRTK